MQRVRHILESLSSGLGGQPRWRRDGKELFYIAPDGGLMAVDTQLTSQFQAGPPKKLFATRITDVDSFGIKYAVSADGQRFLISNPLPDQTKKIGVILNWTALLKKKTP